jgi:hypothetical protein
MAQRLVRHDLLELQAGVRAVEAALIESIFDVPPTGFRWYRGGRLRRVPTTAATRGALLIAELWTAERART